MRGLWIDRPVGLALGVQNLRKAPAQYSKMAYATAPSLDRVKHHFEHGPNRPIAQARPRQGPLER